jgi:hypothetical protein
MADSETSVTFPSHFHNITLAVFASSPFEG